MINDGATQMSLSQFILGEGGCCMQASCNKYANIYFAIRCSKWLQVNVLWGDDVMLLM